jgi:hypothetical protein
MSMNEMDAHIERQLADPKLDPASRKHYEQMTLSGELVQSEICGPSSNENRTQLARCPVQFERPASIRHPWPGQT